MENFISFAISSDLTAMAISEIDGSIRLYKAKNLLEDEIKESLLTLEKNPIINMFFFRNESGLHMFYMSKKNNVYCY